MPKSTDLTRQVRETLADLQRFEVVEVKGQLAQELVEASSLLAPKRDRLAASMAVLRIIAGAGLVESGGRKEVTVLKKKVPNKINKYRERLSKTPPEPKGGQDLSRLAEAVDALSKKAREVALGAWRSHRDPVISDAERKLGIAAETQTDIKGALQDALEEFRALTEPPGSEEEFERHESLRHRVLEFVGQIQTIEIPDNVARFLSAAERPQGAQFRMLTPEVYDWVRGQPEIRDSLKVRRS